MNHLFLSNLIQPFQIFIYNGTFYNRILAEMVLKRVIKLNQSSECSILFVKYNKRSDSLH